VIAIKKIIVGIVLVLLTTIFITGCTSPESPLKSPKEPPEITVTIGDKEIDYVVAKNKWNNAIYDREDTFQTILKKDFKVEIPYIEIGKTAVISFNSNSPDKLIISDILFGDNGLQMYSDKEVINIPVDLKDGKCSFEVNNHFASALSSYYVEGKTNLRGFRMIATWGDNECEYAFMIRTDSF
jgi:hypothetical protein